MQPTKDQTPKFTNSSCDSPKKQATKSKMGRRPTYTFLQRRYTDGQEAHEKIFNISSYQRNANQNYNEISPHTGQNGHHQKVYKCWRGCEETNLHSHLHCWWECKLVQSLRTVGRFLKNLKTELPYDPAIPFLGICLEKNLI